MRIGVLGGGQLGRMLALAGQPLGLEFVFYDRDSLACAASVGDLVVGEFDDDVRLTAFAKQVDLVTVEFENIPLATLKHVAQFVPVYPSPDAISVAQDRFAEKQFFKSLGIPTPEFYAVDNVQSLSELLEHCDKSFVVKSRRFGYDGKGQMLMDTSTAVNDAWASLGGVPLVAEQFMKFDREVSIIAARNHSGDISFYPLVENLHVKGILKRSKVSIHDSLQNTAEDYMERVLSKLDYVGVMAFEFFVCDGKLVANEIAPRVHNSGHWTIEGASVSQFENHLRAILNWPMGDTSVRAQCLMYNIIGEQPNIERLLKIPDAHLHLYGKAPRSGRKLGHLTLWGPTMKAALAVEEILNGQRGSGSLSGVTPQQQLVV